MALTVLKYDRSQYYNVVTPRGEPELDPLTFSWIGFKNYMIGRRTVTRTVTADEEGNLPLIAYKIYGDTSLWWVLGIMSDVMDPLLEVKAGTTITVPIPIEIDNYLQSLTSRRRLTTDRLPVARV